MKHKEIAFEMAIEESLVTQGRYTKGNAKSEYDAHLALFPQEVTGYIQQSQPKAWKAIEALRGSETGTTILEALVKELSTKGSLHVLRHGFKCFGKTIRLASFQPNSNLNKEAWEEYALNRLRIYRQVHYSPNDTNLSIDVVLTLNGLPVVTLELKNPMTGQTVKNAQVQYQKDRDPRELIFRFKERSLVHFAVDPDWVYMTTKLEGKDTRFLPFNLGHNHGAGNPTTADGGYRTAYLWEEVLTRDSLLDIIARFIHLQVDEKQVATQQGLKKVRKESMIFPRYHQLDVVRKLVGSAREKGSGHNYLIQHSAGSGKSNSIAWLAHRLSSLHDASDSKVFDTVVVVTDRLVLDRQLQDTIYQFEHKQGVVQKIDENAQQLAKALAGNVPIVISTIQKFPFIAKAIDTLSKNNQQVSLETKGKRFAVIVDEAHSSQSGEAAQELRKILNKDGIASAVAELIFDMDEEELSEEAKQELLQEMLKRPRQPNLSFFAFTATPKFKTKAIFNEPGPNGKPPFHLYSMRQAIEEGFILDVLANYTSYKTFFGLVTSITNDPKVPKRQAAIALMKFMRLHPVNIGQKVQVMVEHFRTYTRKKIGGRAKAMVVTGSRLEAVRYKLEFDRYIKQQGYSDIRTLVAFSGTVVDPELPGENFTEINMNGGIKETELPEKFATDEYQVLLVAEKYQTGFDQPLLHTMYVDKRLSGIQAVQTLSRLNRTAPGKVDTFVLDFVNDRDEIYESFKPYYEQTGYDKDPDPQHLYLLQHELEQAKVFEQAEVNAFCDVWFTNRANPLPSDHQKMNNLLDQAVERYKLLDEQDQELFKGKLNSFRQLYTFLAQIIPYQDSALEKLSTYGRFLLTKLPASPEEHRYQLDDEVALKYYRLQKITEGAISLAGEPQPVYGPSAVGTAKRKEDQIELSLLIDKLNERFGTEFQPADQLFFDQVRETGVSNEQLQEVAKANSFDNFRLIFSKLFEKLFISRLEGNEEIFAKLMSDERLRGLAEEQIAGEVYSRIREEAKVEIQNQKPVIN